MKRSIIVLSSETLVINILSNWNATNLSSICFLLRNINLLKPCGKMYVILVYDVGEKRVAKMLKLCRQYLNWIQNSVFEGEITEVKLKELIVLSKKILNERTDSVIIFSSRDQKWLDKQIIGVEKSDLSNIF
nr:CRISPR-associated endonuclease Cas2 [Chitinophaga terrae (ex Kim and Jung 2007)]